MKLINKISAAFIVCAGVFSATSCDVLNEPQLNLPFTDDTDYTDTENMQSFLIGAYAQFQSLGWEQYPLLAVRGDDVNSGGLGDQQDYQRTDEYNYNVSFWMYNSVWQGFYIDMLGFHAAMEEITKFKEFAPNPALADQYIAEIKVLRAFLLLQVVRNWGTVFIPTSSKPADFLVMNLSSKDEVMQHISDQMDEAIPLLANLRPNQRTDIPGGVTKFTALALKAIANLEMENYQGVADATSQIITPGLFTLHADYYQLFKVPGKLSNENLLELQYSDLGQGSGPVFPSDPAQNAFFGPQGWRPAVTGAGDGWGFFEPSLKYIKFMIDRNEVIRLKTSVLFTPRGIDVLQTDPAYATLPTWITSAEGNFLDTDANQTPYTAWVTDDGDRIRSYSRAMFASGKHYLPSNQLTTGRTNYATNKNFICIRYAEVLLMHAEALTRGATSSSITALQAINLVRSRAGVPTLTTVTSEDVMDEKFAELAMEWGIRYFDLIRLDNTAELTYDGRTFTADKTYLPYPQTQQDQLPILRTTNNNE